ncbi:MAG: polysaccharide biosynthesis protein [Sandaracinaceae bacterium]|nr:polysaccharide biosynthesis protein [Sandaracinaceae bacterium]
MTIDSDKPQLSAESLPPSTDPGAPWWTRLPAKQLRFFMDVAVLSAMFWLSYGLRFDFDIPSGSRGYALIQYPFVIAFQFAALYLMGVHTFMWRYVGLSEVKPMAKAALVAALPLVAMRFGLPNDYQAWRVPISVILSDTGLVFAGVLGIRIVRRMLYERFEKERSRREDTSNAKNRPVLLVGAGRAGVAAMREIVGRSDMSMDVVGFVDDDPEKIGSVIHGVKVLGTTDQLPALAHKLNIDHVVITIARASRQEIRRVVSICEKIPVKVRIIPGLYELLQGNVEVSRIRDMQIEDLLGREPVQLDEEEVGSFLAGKRVLITGAGGSIGSELCRQVARYMPGSLLLVERAEPALFTIDRELREAWPNLVLEPLVADVCDENRMRAIFRSYQPQIVLHAAAHKHVPLMEQNPCESIKNNVLGTKLVGELSGQHGAEAFVLISTDKAVNPTSVMGASKRCAELVVQDLDGRYESTRFLAVRFGNVLGSAGSVIPIFREQIRKGGPVSVTHPDMVRYFMTIPEASQLVLQTAAMGDTGEIFILDMGEPVRILDLAVDMITLSGLKPHEDIPIVFSGIRPGEKLFEELETDTENMAKTKHPKIFIGRIEPYPEQDTERIITQLSLYANSGQSEKVRETLSAFLPGSKLSGQPASAAVHQTPATPKRPSSAPVSAVELRRQGA